MTGGIRYTGRDEVSERMLSYCPSWSNLNTWSNLSICEYVTEALRRSRRPESGLRASSAEKCRDAKRENGAWKTRKMSPPRFMIIDLGSFSYACNNEKK